MPEIKTVKYSHDAMIDLIIAQPSIQQGEIAHELKYTETWVSIIVNSDAFQARLAERKAELVDPVIMASIDDRLRGMISTSIDIVQHEVETTRNPKLALEVLMASGKLLGLGVKDVNVHVGDNFVVALPPKEPSGKQWLEKFGHGQVIDTVPQGV